MKRRYIWLALAVAAVVVSAITYLILPKHDSGPRYKGKTVEGWLRRLTNGDNPEVKMMLDDLGSNAVPPLIVILDRETPVQDWLSINTLKMQWMPRVANSKAAKHLLEATEMPFHAHSALAHLGTNAVCAIPDLERIICDPRKKRGWSFALGVLANLGPHGRVALQRCVTNAPPSRSSRISGALRLIDRPPGTASQSDYDAFLGTGPSLRPRELKQNR